MSEQRGTCLPVAIWYLRSESDEPLGQMYRCESESLPVAGARIQGQGTWSEAEVVEFTELRPTCAMRRFQVVIRVLD